MNVARARCDRDLNFDRRFRWKGSTKGTFEVKRKRISKNICAHVAFFFISRRSRVTHMPGLKLDNDCHWHFRSIVTKAIAKKLWKHSCQRLQFFTLWRKHFSRKWIPNSIWSSFRGLIFIARETFYYRRSWVLEWCTRWVTKNWHLKWLVI